MKILEAIQYLRDHGLICESPKFMPPEAKRYGQQIGLNHKSNVAAGRYNVKYEDDKRYNDHEGKRWLLIKNRDEETIYRAILDGMFDVYLRINGDDSAKATKIETIKKLYRQAENIKDIKYIINEYFDIKKANDIYRFLKKYMKGETTVYRGFNFNNDEYNKLVSGHKIMFKHDLLKLLNNKNKRFNSFSVSYHISKSFADGDHHAIVIAGEAEPNDVNWAFTAYLMGRHHSIGEFELNLNNLKNLKNLRIITDPNLEYRRNKAKLPKIKDLQKQLDNGTPLEELFDVLRLKGPNKIGRAFYLSYLLLIRDNKILTGFYLNIETLNSDTCIVNDGTHDQLYRFCKGPYSNKYYQIGSQYDEKLPYILAINDDKTTQILNINTGEEVLPESAERITRVNRIGMNKFGLFKHTGLNQIWYKTCTTIVDKNYNNLLPDYKNIRRIDYESPDQGIIKVFYKADEKLFKYADEQFVLIS